MRGNPLTAQDHFFTVGFIAAFALISFQNCARTSSAARDSQSISSVQYVKTDASLYSLLKVDEIALQPASLTADQIRQQKTSPLRVLEIDLEKGTLYIIPRDGDGPGEMYSLDADDQTNLKDMLAEAQICEPVVPVSRAEIACTAEYVFPYVELSHDEVVKKLGEKTSGCQVPVDLCDDKGAAFKQYLRDLIDKTASMPY